MTTSLDIDAASQAKWHRRELADEIARAAIACVKHGDDWGSTFEAAAWAMTYPQSWTIAFGYARGYLDARRP